MPTRLLDVGTTTSPELRLVLSALHGVAPYAALSHCWGKARVHTTTIATIAQHLQALPITKLPNTFKNAIEVVRRLNLRLLWIDSLCIVQDDESDWYREAAAMALVYSNAHITIMASRSSSSAESFLEHRNRPLVLKEETTDSGHKVQFRLVNSDFHHNSIYRVTHSSQHPLHGRAWVLQERLLSRRKLLFCSDQVFWECKQLAMSEDRQVQEDLTQRISEPVAQALEEWFRIVADYSACNITYDKDLLPAIGGIARKYANSTGLSYSAGIWLDVFAPSLLWYAEDRSPHCKKHGTYVAPSFSWASLQRPAKYSGRWRSRHNFCTYVTHHQDLPEHSSDPFGVVTGASITLNGPVLQISRLNQDQWTTTVDLKLHNGERYRLPVDFDHSDTVCDPAQTVLLPLYDDEKRFESLVLSRHGSSSNTYRRVGISRSSAHYLAKTNWWGAVLRTDDKEQQHDSFVQGVLHQPRETIVLT